MTNARCIHGAPLLSATCGCAANTEPPMSVDEWNDLRRWLVNEGGFLAVRQLRDGSVAGLLRLMTTLAICLGVSRQCPYERRFCFVDRELAVLRFGELQSEDDTPEGWHARRPELPCDREAKNRPGYLGGDPSLPTSWETAACP